ncbi:FAD:protein FMN transferase [Sphingomonas hylomeconis]|uniref:FAD:protein FMN transferase n=1 Tax=Sphingomonas hylomeconis TaxID=1395958 RepID=A0ABV7SXM1_9SPHN|nr:FAD:protein FMN transferase [Sphingomonas hylomeconis]
MRIALPAQIDGSAFASHDPAAPIVALDGLTMGTSWRVLFVPPRGADTGVVQRAIVTRLAGLVAEMSHWDSGSILARFNRAAAGTWTTLPPDFAHVMAAGLRSAALSEGAFDPAIGRLVDLWGFGPPGAMPAPDAAEIAAARAASGWQRLDFDPAARRLRQPGGVALDLSGIAKGHAVDALADVLRASGVRHALVEVGGELAGFGIRPDGDPWWVDLEAPPGADLPPLRVALHGLAAATSGDYARGAHNLDPRTGRPAAHGVVSVSVLHASAMEADAWASALTVLGPGGITLADRMGLAARIVTVTGGAMREHLSAALTAML